MLKRKDQLQELLIRSNPLRRFNRQLEKFCQKMQTLVRLRNQPNQWWVFKYNGDPHTMGTLIAKNSGRLWSCYFKPRKMIWENINVWLPRLFKLPLFHTRERILVFNPVFRPPFSKIPSVYRPFNDWTRWDHLNTRAVGTKIPTVFHTGCFLSFWSSHF